MSEPRLQNLILIPDYLSAAAGSVPPGELTMGDATKVPAELRRTSFWDVNDAESRQKLMLLVPVIARATVLTPSTSYYRRLCELRDDCYFANLTLRLLAVGAFVTVKSGMRRESVMPQAAAWMRELLRAGVRIEFEQAAGPALPQKELVTAADVAACARQGRRELVAAPGAIVTPYARDEAKERGVTILTGIGGQV